MRYAGGKHSWSVCDRCGGSYKYLSIENEPDTKFRVCRSCNDGMWNLIGHPQNGPFSVSPEGINLRYPRREVDLTSVGTSVSVWMAKTPHWGVWEFEDSGP